MDIQSEVRNIDTTYIKESGCLSFYLLNYSHYFYQNDLNKIQHLVKTNAMLIFHKYFLLYTGDTYKLSFM